MAVRAFLDPERPELRTTAVIADGRIHAIGVWGTPEVDEDPTLRWSLFLTQISVVQRRHGISTLLETDHAAVERWLTGLDGKGRTLLTQVRAMASNVQLERAGRMLAPHGKRPPSEWYERQARVMAELEEEAGAFEDVLGTEGVEAYEEHARETAIAMQAVASSSRALEGDDVPDDAGLDHQVALDVLDEACTACHVTTIAGGELRFRGAFGPALESIGLPVGALHVGVDLAPASGDDEGLSAAFAAGARLALLVAHESE